MSEPCTILVIIKMKPEHRQELFDMMKNQEDGAALTRKHKGCISVEGRMSTEDDETVVVWTKWTSKEEHAEYVKTRAMSGFFAKWADKMAGPTTTMYLSKDSF